MIKKSLLLLVLIEIYSGYANMDDSSCQQLLNDDAVKIENKCTERCIEDVVDEDEKVLIEYDEVLQKAVRKIRVTIANHNAKPGGLNP